MDGSVRGRLLAAIAVLAPIAAAAQDARLFRFDAPPGPHAVGLEVVEQYDFSRVYKYSTDELGAPSRSERARPLQTLIWYPAERGSRPMTIGDYADLLRTETSFGEPHLSIDGQEQITGMQATVALPLRAMRDAPRLPGHFPLLIYAPSFSSTAWENADLCEYLASFGYVVIASPSMGAMTRSMTRDLQGIDTQARDILFLLGYARTLPNADMTRVAVVGFSWGGMSNLLAAARDNRIGALVALDGSLRYFPGLIRESGEVHPEQMTLPLLYFASQLSLEDFERFHTPAELQGPNILNLWTHGDLVFVRMLGLVHSEFSSMYQRNEDEWEQFAQRQQGDYTRGDGIVGYAWIARYTVRFLDAYLKADAASMEFLKRQPADNGVPAHVLALSFRRAAGPAPSFAAFREEVGHRGFAHAAEVYEEIRARTPGFALNEEAVYEWARRLIDATHLPDALTLLELNAKLHPNSTDAYFELGDAYGRSGNTAAARANFEKSVAMDANNEDARRRLRLLKDK